MGLNFLKKLYLIAIFQFTQILIKGHKLCHVSQCDFLGGERKNNVNKSR